MEGYTTHVRMAEGATLCMQGQQRAPYRDNRGQYTICIRSIEGGTACICENCGCCYTMCMRMIEGLHKDRILDLAPLLI